MRIGPRLAGLPKRAPTLTALTVCWPLLLGVSLLMIGQGLQGTLLGLRAEMEGFAAATTGWIMAGYYIGFFGGCLWARSVIRTVGYVRTFAAFASVASIAVLIHAVWVDPFVWFAARLATGLAYSALYIVAEGWLNGRATNKVRGSIMSLYLATQLLSVAAGQLLINFADPSGTTLFILASVAVSAGLVPLLLTRIKVPAPERDQRLSLRRLLRLSPLGTFLALTSGMIIGGFSGMGAYYATSVGLSTLGISAFMMAYTISGGLAQWPVGKLSDLVPRRLIIALLSGAAAVLAGVAMTLENAPDLLLIGAIALLGMFVLPLYALANAQTNDQVSNDQRLATATALMLLYGAGSIAGPLLASLSIESFGEPGFFIYFAVIATAVAAFTLIRILISDASGRRRPILRRLSATG